MNRGTAAAKVVAVVWLAFLTWMPAAHAETENCAQLREDIYRLERESVRPPGFVEFSSSIRSIYRDTCIDAPLDDRRSSPKQSWYRIDGTPTGVPADKDRPADGAYLATDEIGKFCAGRPGMEPSMCAMLAELGQFCAHNGSRDQLAKLCAEYDQRPAPDPSRKLYRATITIDGEEYSTSTPCDLLLVELQTSNPSTAIAADWAPRLGLACSPDLVEALSRKLAMLPTNNAFWPALSELILNGFGNRPPQDPTFKQASELRDSPGYSQMCSEAKKNRDTCMERWKNMRSVGEDTLGQDGQAGAFQQCFELYANVYAMCEGVPRQALELKKRARKPEAARPQAASGQSAPPPKPAPQMSAQCQQLVSNYVSAAKANDGARALSGYNALKNAGGCSVLGKVDRGMPAPPQAAAPAGPDPRFVSRGATPQTDQYVQPCAADRAGCNQAVRQLQQGASPEAQAAMISHAISTGLSLGAAMAGGLAAAMPPPQTHGGGSYAVPGNNTDMRSLAAPPIHGGVGQGSGRPRSGNNDSTITGPIR